MRKLMLVLVAFLVLPVMAFAAVDLNTASKSDLQSLPGVGPKVADEIISARPFKTVNDLAKIKGLGAKKIAKIAPLVSVEAPAPPAARMASRHATSGASSAAAKKLAPYEKININTAAVEELERLPEIGPQKAAAIVQSRPFQKPEDIMRVHGIKQGIFAKIKDHIEVQ